MGRWDRASRATASTESAPNARVQACHGQGEGISMPICSEVGYAKSSEPQPCTEEVGSNRSWRNRRSGYGDQLGASEQEDSLTCWQPASLLDADDKVPALAVEGPARPGLGCTVKLRRGVRMPQMGLGGGMSSGDQCRQAFAAALLEGYRLIDTAVSYGTEQDVMAGIRLAGLKRSDDFISTKLLQKAHKSDQEVYASLRMSLKNLGTDYVDLYLIHNPRAGRIKHVWPLLLEMRDQGLVRAVGVSNFGIGQLEGMRQAGLEMPEVNQIEIHPWRQLPEVVEYHKKHSIATMCMAPLARCQMFGQSSVTAVASEIGRSEAEVAIRWSLQNGYIPIPKSICPDRIELNTAKGFDLSQKQMAKIEKGDCGYMSCRGSSPCCELAWKLVASKIPDQAILSKNKNSVLKEMGDRGYWQWAEYSAEA